MKVRKHFLWNKIEHLFSISSWIFCLHTSTESLNSLLKTQCFEQFHISNQLNVGGNWSTHKKPTWTQREHTNSGQKDPRAELGIEPGTSSCEATVVSTMPPCRPLLLLPWSNFNIVVRAESSLKGLDMSSRMTMKHDNGWKDLVIAWYVRF